MLKIILNSSHALAKGNSLFVNLRRSQRKPQINAYRTKASK